MVSGNYKLFPYVTVLIQVTIIFNVKCVFSANLGLHGPDVAFNKLQEKLDTTDVLVESLAIEICWDVQFYNSKTPREECEKNFIKSVIHKGVDPPDVQPRCQYQSNVVYEVAPSAEPAWPLVVLITNKNTLDYLPYDLVTETNNKWRTLKVPKHDQYTIWTTLLYHNGSHSPWLRGQEIKPWNLTGELPQRKYSIKVKGDHELVNGSSTVNMHFTWNSYDDEDVCFDLVNQCDGKIKQIQILPKAPQGHNSGTISGLPLGASCKLLLIGKHGTTTHQYHTPRCNNMETCIDLSIVQNISLVAEPGTTGWDVYVSWTRHHEPLFYNVTLISDNDTRSVQLPGHVTETIFAGVEDKGVYLVAIGSVLKNWTVWTNARAMFPVERRRWGALGAALGGAWGALAAAVALLAALALLWRRRHAAARATRYFPEQEDKPAKVGECDADTESIAAADDWELRSERLLLHEVVGEGAFGVVRRGTLAPAGREVAVKMLKDFPTLDEVRSFRAEMELMKSVGAHPHVVSLVGCCSGRRPFIVAEYCSRGDLLSYLRCSWDVMVSKRNAKYYNNNIETTDYRNDLFKCKLQGEHSKLVVNKLYDLQGICDTDLTTRDLLSFCRQIAMGMEFLAANRLVHRDLAARNVLVSSDRTLKIADFGLSRDVYEENLYMQKGNGKMPMKWMALESLTRRIYTSQSDVWSFGVVMWEVASVGGSPYAGVPPARLPRLLRAGYRMPRPANCTKQLYEVMSSCWRAHPRARPTFAELHARLDELLGACAHDYLALELGADDAPPARPHRYVAMLIRDKLGWSRGDSYSRPVRTAQSNHYSSPPACALKVQSVS